MKKSLNLITEAFIFYISRAIVSFLWLCFFVLIEAILVFNSIVWYYHIFNFSLIAFFFYFYLKNVKLFIALNIEKIKKSINLLFFSFVYIV